MKKLQHFFVILFEFLTSKRISRYIVTIAVCVASMVAVGTIVPDLWMDVIGIFFGFLISNLTVGLFAVFFSSFEDGLKVLDDTKKILSIYPEDNLETVVTLNGTSCTVAYNPVLFNDNYTLIVKDDPEKQFELDGFLENNYLDLFAAHHRSSKRNFDTVRLDDCTLEGNTATFYLSRSTYYHHLITNRAVDYLLDDDLSVRTYFDYGPKLVPLNKSKMSNHVGINGLVYLKDGELLLPRRTGSSTISKNMITSSIAIMLSLPKSGEVTSEYLFKDCILNNLVSRARMNPAWIKEDEIDVQFLGCGQNPYEGGKPQFYYAVRMNNVTREDYLRHLAAGAKMDAVIDKDKYMYVVDPSTMCFTKNENLQFIHNHGRLDKKGALKVKAHKTVVNYEKSFLCNVWHKQIAWGEIPRPQL
ncbi:MAG: hypothetical protein IJ996_04380 [Clostridia bacterium]|nr:hypothetical protein [Clostridia bacterium]